MEQLNEVLERKIQERDEMSVTDESFKDAANAVSTLVETNAKVDDLQNELAHKKRDSFWSKVLLVVTGVGVPILLKCFDNKNYNDNLDKVLEYEKTGAVISSGGKSVLSGLRRK